MTLSVKSATKTAEPPVNELDHFPMVELAKSRGVLPFERGNRPRDHIYASELGSCVRSVWFEWHHPGFRDESFSEKRGALGHAIEEVHAKKIAPLIVSREVSFYDELHHISGRVDFVVRLSYDGPMIPNELKSTVAYDRFLKSPMASHLLQLRYYLTQIPEAPYGLLTYYSLSNWNGKMGEEDTLIVPRDDESVYKRARFMWRVIHMENPPTCEHENEKEPCFSCSIGAETRVKLQARC